MPDYKNIFDPETLAKLNAKSAESARIMLGNKDLMRVMMSSQALLSKIIQAESSYKPQLERLAVEIVKDQYPKLVQDEINIDAKILSNVTLEENTPQEKKRRIANALAQGASVAELFKIFQREEVAQKINAINPSLYEAYNQIMNNTFGIYNNDQAIDMMLAAIAAGHSSIGGSSKIITEALGIEAQAICFPMLVHEIIKGYWSIIAQSGLTGSEEERIATISKVDKLENEPLDIRYGPIIFKKLETIYNAFTPSDIDPRTFVMFYMSILKLEPEDKFFSFVGNIIGDKPLSEDQIAWIEDKLERMQAYLRKKDTERAMSSFSNNDEDDDINVSESTKLTDIVKSIIQEESTQYKFDGLLQTDTVRRPQKDILSDIRSLPGVTIVSSKDYDLSGETSAFSNPNYYSILRIKVDPHPFMTGGGFKDEDLQTMLSDIRKIDGVKNFKLTQSVEKSIV
jgi:hypothetical protein